MFAWIPTWAWIVLAVYEIIGFMLLVFFVTRIIHHKRPVLPALPLWKRILALVILFVLISQAWFIPVFQTLMVSFHEYKTRKR